MDSRTGPANALRQDIEGLDATSAARLIGISRSHFYQLAKRGKIPPPIRLGGSVRWLRSELLSWMFAGAHPSQKNS